MGRGGKLDNVLTSSKETNRPRCPTGWGLEGALRCCCFFCFCFFVSVQNIAPQIDRIDLFLAGVKFSHVCPEWNLKVPLPPFRYAYGLGGEIGTMYTLGTNHLFGCVKWKKKRMARLHFVIFRGTRWGYDIVKNCRGWLTFPPEDGKITLVSSTKNT